MPGTWEEMDPQAPSRLLSARSAGLRSEATLPLICQNQTKTFQTGEQSPAPGAGSPGQAGLTEAHYPDCDNGFTEGTSATTGQS